MRLAAMRMNLNYLYVLSACLLGSLITVGSANASPGDTELVALVQRYAEAQSNYDQASLEAVTAENFVEISPIGEVDKREKMISFYGPEHKRPSPQLIVDEEVVRVFGDTAVVSARLSYRLNQDGIARSFSMRAGYVARFVDARWLLISAQYTGIRPPKQ